MTKNKYDFNATSGDDIELNNSPNVGGIFATSNIDENDGNQAIILESKRDENINKKPSKGKKTEYKKGTFIHQLRTIGILMFLGIFTGCGLGVWYFNTELRNDTNYNIDQTPYLYDLNSIMASTVGLSNPDDYSTFVVKAQEQGKTPLDFTPAENFALAEYHSSLASTWSSIGHGQIQTIVTQDIYSEKKFDGNKYTFVNMSSGMVSVARCFEYFKDAPNVKAYDGKSPTAESATWVPLNEKSTDDFKEEMGVLPSSVQPYIISDKTITKGNEKTNMVYDETSQTYSFTIELDTVLSVLNYVRQVRSTGGLQSYPKFNSIVQTIVIDKDWNLVSIEIKDNYDAVMGLKVNINGYLKNYYTFNQSVEMPV